MAVAIHSSMPVIHGVDPRHLRQVSLLITETTQVSEARRTVAERTKALHFNETTAGEAAIVATEMAGNLVKHAGGGELLVRTIGDDAHCGIELLALDRGRGMDVQRCLVDGYSTAASPGTGLGAIRRMSTTADFYSRPDGGTAVLATIWRSVEPKNGRWIIGGINVPIRGEEISGDAWVVRCQDRGIDAMLVDGLGHGPDAAKAASAAVASFLSKSRRSPLEQLGSADAALRFTRGAAVGVAVFDLPLGHVTFAGIGNTAAVVISDDAPQQLVSFGGIVGQRTTPHREFETPWSSESTYVAHSDGIGTRWNLADYPGLAVQPPSLIAGVLYRDFARGRDDASIVVIKPKR